MANSSVSGKISLRMTKIRMSAMPADFARFGRIFREDFNHGIFVVIGAHGR